MAARGGLLSLEALLLARVRSQGPMTFRDFMAQALYHPEHGYYATGRPWEGEGDFTTAPRYGEAFALAVARLAARLRDAMGPGPFEVVEVGAGSGALAAQLHRLLQGQGVRLRVVEVRRPPRLPAGVPWSASARGLAVRGLVVSNELFDALPVHRVLGTPGGPREVVVQERAGRLVQAPGPAPAREVTAYLERFGLLPGEGQVVETGLDALALFRELAGALEHGLLLTIDYGAAARELLHHGREGTLQALRAHRLAPDPLAAPGLQDLTAHVNFTALREEGAALGLDEVAHVAQWEFLAASGALEEVASLLGDPARFEEGLAAKALAAPGRMGDFRVLAQSRGLDAAARARVRAGLAAGPADR